MAKPFPIVVRTSGAEAAAPAGSFPVDLYGATSGAEVTPQAAPTVNATPTDAAEVAGDLQGLVDALVAAGVLTA